VQRHFLATAARHRSTPGFEVEGEVVERPGGLPPPHRVPFPRGLRELVEHRPRGRRAHRVVPVLHDVVVGEVREDLPDAPQHRGRPRCDGIGVARRVVAPAEREQRREVRQPTAVLLDPVLRLDGVDALDRVHHRARIDQDLQRGRRTTANRVPRTRPHLLGRRPGLVVQRELDRVDVRHGLPFEHGGVPNLDDHLSHDPDPAPTRLRADHPPSLATGAGAESGCDRPAAMTGIAVVGGGIKPVGGGSFLRGQEWGVG
jgi:hypothetical protein